MLMVGRRGKKVTVRSNMDRLGSKGSMPGGRLSKFGLSHGDSSDCDVS